VILPDTAWSGMIPQVYRAVLVGLAIKGTLVYVLAHLFTRSARWLSAERRHWLWLAVLLMFVALPAAQFLVPVVHLPLGEALPRPATSREISQPPASSSPLNSLRVWEAASSVAFGVMDKRFDSWITLALAGIWTVGTLLMLSRLGVGLLAFAQMLRSDKVKTVPASCYRALARLAGAAVVRVVAHPRVEIPFAFGILRPTIVVPGRWSSWTKERLNIVLMHELAHVKRWDALWNVAAQIVCALMWMNPLAWKVCSLLQREAELSCDDLVLSFGVPPTAYASTILGILRSARGAALRTPSLARGGSKTLRERLTRILSSGPDRIRPRLRKRSRGVAVAAGLLLPLLALSFSFHRVEKFNGAWRSLNAVNATVRGDFFMWNGDGTGFRAEAANPDVPARWCRYALDRKQTDARGYTTYHLRARWADRPLVLYTVIRIEPSGNRYEEIDSTLGYAACTLGLPADGEKQICIRQH
jgi:beta-lactamase regulating signal transducer with metallopeptidase domain